MKKLFRVSYTPINKLHKGYAFDNIPRVMIVGDGIKGLEKGKTIEGIGVLVDGYLSIAWFTGSATRVALDVVKDEFILEEIIDVSKEELTTIMDDSEQQVGWSDSSRKICEFVGIDPTEGT